MLTFNAEKHEYFLNGKRVPSVTQILTDCGHIDTTFFTPESRELGTKVHKMINNLLTANGYRNLYYCQEAIEYYKEFAPFYWTRINKLVAYHSEIMLSRKAKYGYPAYAGTADFYGTLDDGKRYLIDFKTGGPAPWHRLQLGGYADAMRFKPHCLASLYLRKDGYYLAPHYDVETAKHEWRKVLLDWSNRNPMGCS
jgi:hypothetical protein